MAHHLARNGAASVRAMMRVMRAPAMQKAVHLEVEVHGFL
jgi:hypothetical protein